MQGSEAPHIVVLGAGVCGLYAGRVLAGAGMRVTVLERDEVVGGLAAGRLRDGNFFDLGVHHLHAFDQEIFEDVKALMGEQIMPIEKRALIRYGRGYRRYPLEFVDLLLGIPPWTLARAMGGLLVQQLRNRRKTEEAANAEEALIELYGRPLYGFFFKGFTERYWGIPPTELSAAFVRRKMPRLSAVDIIKKALGRVGVSSERDGEAVEKASAEETLWYGRTGAREMPMALAREIRARGGRVLVDRPVVGIECEDDRVVAVRYLREGVETRLPCDACLSTIPLTHFVRAFDPPAPPEALSATRSLRYRPMVVYGLLVNKPRVLEALYVYYRERIFHRIAEPKNSGIKVTPEGHTVILVEMMCELSDDRWNMGRATLQQMVRDLEAEGLLEGRDIVEVHLVRAEEAYPVFDLGFEAHQAVLTEQVEALDNALSTGRQGAFCYPNMHTAMRMGADAAQDFIARGASLSRNGRMRLARNGHRAKADREAGALGSSAPPAPAETAKGATADAAELQPLAAPSTDIYMPDGDQRGATPAEELALGAPEAGR